MPYYTDPNQTKFSLEEPLFEQIGQIPQDEIEQPVKKTPLLKQKKFIIMLIVGVTVLIMALLFLVNAYIEGQKKVQEQEPTEVIIPTTSEINHPIYQRIKAAQDELKEADPSEQDLVYPTLDHNIRLDKKTR